MGLNGMETVSQSNTNKKFKDYMIKITDPPPTIMIKYKVVVNMKEGEIEKAVQITNKTDD